MISTATGRTKAITSGLRGATAVQYHSYTYDTLGNVTGRSDSATGRMESFAYDGLNRLTSHNVVGGATVSVTYDALGNIKSKSDLGENEQIDVTQMRADKIDPPCVVFSEGIGSSQSNDWGRCGGAVAPPPPNLGGKTELAERVLTS